MIATLIMTLFSLLIFLIVMILSTILGKKTILDREKNIPYECGFYPKDSTQLLFSLRIFLITVIFLIIDVEITLFLLIAPMFNLTNTI